MMLRCPPHHPLRHLSLLAALPQLSDNILSQFPQDMKSCLKIRTTQGFTDTHMPLGKENLLSSLCRRSHRSWEPCCSVLMGS